MRKRLLVAFSSLLALVLVGLMAIAWGFGPRLGIALTGRPFFLLPPSPERYAETILEVADHQAIHADSDEYLAARERALAVAKDASSTAEVHDALEAALEAAGGKHSGILNAVEREEWAQSDPAPSPGVTVLGAIAIATVPAFDGFASDGRLYAETLGRGLDSALSGPATCAVVDLRGNGGGDMGPMLAGVSPLLPDGTALEFESAHGTTPVTITGSAVAGGGTPTSVDGVRKHLVPTAILINAGTGSSGEATAIAFKGVEGTRFFGRPTAGYASANIAFEMPDGALVMVTSANDKDRNSVVYGDNPLIPDEQTDDALEAAKAWLAAEHGCEEGRR